MSGAKGRSGGHNKKPTRHKELVGEKHKKRLAQNEPDFVSGKVLPLVKLGEVGQRVWDYYAPMLENNGTMSKADALAFSMLCKKVEDWYLATQQIHPEDVTVTEGMFTKIDPAAAHEVKLFEQVVRMLREFGITPLARSAIVKIGNDQAELPFKGITG